MTAPDSPLALRLIQARHYRALASKVYDLIVLHDEEAKESGTTALHVANWFAGPTSPVASCTYAVDTDEIIQVCREQDEADHAPPVNDRSIGIEMSGYARQSEADWLADVPMLNRCAELVADICVRRGIPNVFVDGPGLLRGERGITTHKCVNDAYHKSSHFDPGPSFPLQHFLELVQDCINGKAIRESLSDLVDGTADTDPAPG